MQTNLIYNPSALTYKAVVTFPELTDESKTKVCLIEDLNKIQLSLTGEQLSTSQFNDFYDRTTEQLQTIVTDQQNVLLRRNGGYA